MEDFKDRDSVSVAIVRDVKPERVDEFEGWLQEVSAALSPVDGYAGMDVVRPRLSRGKTPRCTVILRFDSHDKYALWHNSPERAKLIELADEFSLTRPALQERHGLESWFAPPDDDLIIPPRHKMAILTFGTLYPLILGHRVHSPSTPRRCALCAFDADYCGNRGARCHIRCHAMGYTRL